MRRLWITLGLALFLLGCSPEASSVESEAASAGPSGAVPAAPSGEPIGVVGYGINGDMTCRDQWVEGLLRADMELQNRITGSSQGPITIEVWPLDTVGWPSGVAAERFLAVRWPLEYTVCGWPKAGWRCWTVRATLLRRRATDTDSKANGP